MKLPVNYDTINRSTRRAVREEYIKQQGGNCYHCGCSLKEPAPDRIRNKPVRHELFPEGFFKYPVHLHHSHDTGLTIGAVHNYCNAVLWQYHGE